MAVNYYPRQQVSESKRGQASRSQNLKSLIWEVLSHQLLLCSVCWKEVRRPNPSSKGRVYTRAQYTRRQGSLRDISEAAFHIYLFIFQLPKVKLEFISFRFFSCKNLKYKIPSNLSIPQILSCYVLISIQFGIFLISFVISFLTYGLLSTVVFNFSILGISLDILLLITNLILLWSEDILYFMQSFKIY